MAGNFLAGLPRVAKDELPEDKMCMICHEEYGAAPSDSEPGEEAVRLPCPGGHIVGFNCISSWLSSDMNRRSCPYCRHQFSALTAPLDDRALQLLNYERLLRWFHICQDLRQTVESLGGTAELVQRWERWLMDWHRAARQIPTPSEEQRARARIVRSSLYARTGWSRLPEDTEMVRWSETGSSTEIGPVVFRTRFFREYYYYLKHSWVNGANPGLLRGPQYHLANEHSICIYARLCRIGAFRGVLEDVESMNERWRILRSQGLTFDEERWQWSAHW